ncbi:twisted gastrulation protein homolog 1-A-like [Belonocnema kinseyi]|uniref:twisted gastrulation protein homolog 1-A-like n=1 Tax=Belonocnema kinseyi TaxID=2817044 RepID=UPI00143CE9F1|nr:twisted gastrulation protein homolog 1-A-like [Belonocnema kinseyi]
MTKMIILGIVTVILLEVANFTDACNEAVCGSVVSKCILRKTCDCDVKTCSCCKECYACLGQFYTECCACFGLCPILNSSYSSLNKLSYVEDLMIPVPNLFHALTADPDPEGRWASFTYQDSHFSQSIKAESVQTKNFVREDIFVNEDISVQNADNCTVAYISDCSSLHTCKTSCSGLGATSFRWFHNGCCECIGQHCFNYGLNESRCSKCSNHYNEESPEDIYDDYGQFYDEDYNNLELISF